MDRPLNSKGYYDLNFIDWQNEWESVYEENPDFEENEEYYEVMDPEEEIRYKRIKRNLKSMKMGKTTKSCVICVKIFEKGERIYKIPDCKHIFHSECFDPWIKKKKTCPMCRKNLI